MSDAPSAVRTPSVPEHPTSRCGPCDRRRSGEAHWRERSPIVVFIAVTLAGYALLAALMIGLGFLLVDVVLPFHGIGGADESVNDWLAAHRSSGLDDASYVGSAIGDIPFIPGLVILTALVTAILRKWRAFAFIVGAILVEVGDLPRHEPDRAPPAAVRPAPRSRPPAGQPELPVGPRRGRRRRLRRSRAAALAAVCVPGGPRSRSGHSPSRCRSSSRFRACTAACTTRSTRPPACSWASAALAIALVATRAAGEAARERS